MAASKEVVHSRAHCQLPGWKDQVNGARNQSSMWPAEMMRVKGWFDVIYISVETTEAHVQVCSKTLEQVRIHPLVTVNSSTTLFKKMHLTTQLKPQLEE